ncbi:MAG: transglutaminase domain-containing protein [Clostridiales bacterium]|nr:transglutaminase domain-containing protein [Clostridiales bacterium]
MRKHEGERRRTVTPERIRKERSRKVLSVLFKLFMVLVACAGALGLYARYLYTGILPDATIETGTPIDVSVFSSGGLGGTSFVTDVSGIDTSVPGSYGLKVTNGKYLKVTRDVILNVTDTTAPTGTAVPQCIYVDGLPAAETTVTDIFDLSPVTVSYANAMPEILDAGEYTIAVKLTDTSGNETIIDVPFTVIEDHTAPLIYGPHDFEAFIGDAIVYMDGITATDDYDPNPVLEVDTSAVDVTQEGFYPVTYTATDVQGNSTSTTITLHLRVKPERYYEPEELYELARQIIADNDICDDSMSDMEKAFHIVDWVSHNLHYMMDSDKCDWTAGAYDALTTMHGDCFNYMAMCRAMFGAVGIESITIERYPINVSSHYWNLINIDGQWYHCDACVFLNMTDITYIFMYTDDELDPGNNSYDHDTLPAGVTVATESVQDLLDYDNLTVRSGENEEE